MGVLSLLAPPGSTFTDDETALTTFSRWLALALDNWRLRRELHQQAERQAKAHGAEQKQRRIADALRRLSHLVETSLNLSQVLDRILEELAEVVEYHASTIMLLKDNSLRVTAARGFPDNEQVTRLSFRLDENMRLHRVVEERCPLIFGDDYRPGPFENVAGRTELCSCLDVPLLVKDRLIGLLTVGHGQVGRYGEEDAQTVLAFANHAAIAIENARLYDEAHRRAVQLETAGQVSQKITSILDLDELLREVVELIRGNFRYDHVQVFLVDETSSHVVLHQGGGLPPDYLRRGVRLKIGEEGITGWVASSGQPLVANDVRREPHYSFHELLPQTMSEIAVPMKVGDVVVGVLDVQSDRLNAFGHEDVTNLQALGDQIAVAIVKARLFRETKQRFEALMALHELSLDIAAQLDMPVLLRAIVRRATRLLNAKSGRVYLTDPTSATAGQVVTDDNGIASTLDKGMVGPSTDTAPSGPSMATVSLPLKWQDRVIGVLEISDDRPERRFSEDDYWLMNLFADQAAIAIKNAELYARAKDFTQQLGQKVTERTQELEEAQKELAQKAAQLQWLLAETFNVQEEERSRIAHDMHDGVSQLIIGALYETQAAKQSLPARPGVALNKVQAVQSLLKQMETEIRRVIHDLRPIILDTMGLIPALRQYAETFSELFGIPCSVHVSGSPLRLMPAAETAIYRIVQEAMHNVGTHSTATMAQIYVLFKPTKMRVVVRDNGQGFDYQGVLKDTTEHLGLMGMKERALSIGGTLEVDSAPRYGTRIIFQAPLQAVCQDGECPPVKTSWWENLLGFRWKR